MKARNSAAANAGRFRVRLFVAMTLVITAVTAAAVFFVQHRMVTDLRWNLDQRFRTEFDALLAVQEANNAAVMDRCRALVRSPRIHAALEDGALDILYSIANDQRGMVIPKPMSVAGGSVVPYAEEDTIIRIVGYRFLDENGVLIPPPAKHEAGDADGTLRWIPRRAPREREEVGFALETSGGDAGRVHEMIVTPILSTETGRAIAALVLVFKPIEMPRRLLQEGVRSGVWADGVLDMPAIGEEARQIGEVVTAAGAKFGQVEGARVVDIAGEPQLLQFKRLNPESSLRPGILVTLFPLGASLQHLHSLRWQIIAAGAVLLVAGLIASHFLSKRFSVPVEKLEIVSSANAAHRERAEAALDATNEELRVRNEELQSALSELNSAQQRVIQQERLRALGQMASGVAHDFNNALVPILGFSELLRVSPGALQDREKAMSYINTIHTAAGDAAKVVSRLKQFYRKQDEGDVFESVDVGKLVTQAITLTQPKWKCQMQASGATIQVEPELQAVPPILGDESALREALTNLIFNAVDAMPAGGRVTVRARRDGGAAVIEVADTGTGMSPEVRKRCLEPFFTTKGERGTGLGLSMVFGIIQRHGGTVDIESEIGKGTTFILRLPLPAVESREEKTVDVLREAPRGLGILVVDDEQRARNFVAAALTEDGHRVEIATDGATGLRCFRDGQFDVVITDKAMPGMSGDQMASAMKLMKPGTPVILLTGFGQFLDKADLPGIDVLLSKPVGIQSLRDALATALRAAA